MVDLESYNIAMLLVWQAIQAFVENLAEGQLEESEAHVQQLPARQQFMLMYNARRVLFIQTPLYNCENHGDTVSKYSNTSLRKFLQPSLIRRPCSRWEKTDCSTVAPWSRWWPANTPFLDSHAWFLWGVLLGQDCQGPQTSWSNGQRVWWPQIPNTVAQLPTLTKCDAHTRCSRSFTGYLCWPHNVQSAASHIQDGPQWHALLPDGSSVHSHPWMEPVTQQQEFYCANQGPNFYSIGVEVCPVQHWHCGSSCQAPEDHWIHWHFQVQIQHASLSVTNIVLFKLSAELWPFILV